MELVTIIERPLTDDQIIYGRSWYAKDDKSDGMYKVVIPSKPDPATVQLNWVYRLKKGKETKTKTHYIGEFLFHLKNLLEKGFIRLEKNRSDTVRIQLINDNGIIKIAQGKRKKASGLAIGSINIPEWFYLPQKQKKVKAIKEKASSKRVRPGG